MPVRDKLFPFFRKSYKYMLDSKYRELLKDIHNLKTQPRYTLTSSSLLGRPVQVIDAHSFLAMYEEIYEKEFYKFDSETEHPYIIDCGANIGVSVIWFKTRYPQSELLAFEPDPAIFEVLKKNVEQFNFDNLTLTEAAVWINNDEVTFLREGGVAGQIRESGDIKAKAFRLSQLLDRPIDMLKIDIEGAVHEVLEDCRGKLGLVKNLFVEYHGSKEQNGRLEQLLSILTSAGFMYFIKEAIKIESPFIQMASKTAPDVQLNIFATKRKV